MNRVHARNGYRCERCGEPSTEIAHGISKGKYGRKAIRLTWHKLYNYLLLEKEIDDIVHHFLNTFPSCKACNDFFNIHISQTALVEEKIKEIHEAINRDSKTNL